jgi:hydrogenase maturation factor
LICLVSNRQAIVDLVNDGLKIEQEFRRSYKVKPWKSSENSHHNLFKRHNFCDCTHVLFEFLKCGDCTNFTLFCRSIFNDNQIFF